MKASSIDDIYEIYMADVCSKSTPEKATWSPKFEIMILRGFDNGSQ